MFYPSADRFAQRFVAHDSTLANLTLADFELRLDQRCQMRARACKCERRGKDFFQTDKARIADNDIDRHGNMLGRQMTGVGAFKDNHTVVAAQLPVQLAIADIDRVDLFGATRQQDIRKSSGRRPDIKTGLPRNIDLECLQRAFQFEAATRHPRVLSTANDEFNICGNRRAWLVDPAITREDLAGPDQGLGLCPAFGEPSVDEQNVGTLAGGRRSGPLMGGCTGTVDAERRHCGCDDIGRGQTGNLYLSARGILIQEHVRHHHRAEP